ncbi:MAG: hypothetical protein ABIQ81_00140 [Novosphingobium sp.]
MMGYPETPPARLSSDPAHPDFHPSYRRVGVRIDGVERTDVKRYDVAGGVFVAGFVPQVVAGAIEPYWRWEESRQERRARERWDASHGARA